VGAGRMQDQDESRREEERMINQKYALLVAFVITTNPT